MVVQMVMKSRGKGRKKFWQSGYVLIALGLLLVVLDQALKNLAATSFSENPVSWGFVSFVYAANTGSSFSLLQGYNTFIIWFSVIVLGLMIYANEWLMESKIAYTLLFSGI